MNAINVDEAVKQRYSAGALVREEELCCPVSYNKEYLKILPPEILERDYGCGDPSAHVREGETVLDLGSGAGKICYIAAQVVGPNGRVIGIDINDEMLALARKHQSTVSSRLGFDNVTFLKGKIQDLALNLEGVEELLKQRPVKNSSDLLELEAQIEDQRSRRPLISSESIDLVVSNCVLNLVRPDAKQALFHEIFRVLKPGGRAVISDIVCDQDIPSAMQQNTELWSGCISGAYREDLFIKAFAAAGFQGMELLKRGSEPWKVIQGIQFWSVTVAAYKPKVSLGKGNLTVIYKGPFAQVTDDQGRKWERAVAQTLPSSEGSRFLSEPLASHFEVIAHPEAAQVLNDFKPFTPLTRDSAKSSGCC
ncbi:MAG: methyltransferase [Verrucomicrobiales bacterium]|nr:methyltransferase [Verrucomicrobiales bacterium]